MVDLTYMIVRRLLRDDDVGFSRNKNFDAYDDPKVQRAARIFRHLRSVEDELSQAVPEQVTLCAEPGVLTLRVRASRHTRESAVTPPEWALLMESEEVANLLRLVVSKLPTAEAQEIASAGFALT